MKQHFFKDYISKQSSPINNLSCCFKNPIQCVLFKAKVTERMKIESEIESTKIIEKIIN